MSLDKLDKLNKYGLVLNSYVYANHRRDHVIRSLKSLAQTNVKGLDQPILQITTRKSDFDYSPFLLALGDKFWLQENDETDFEGRGIDPTFICSVNNVLTMYPEITHITYLTDDYVYNPDWLIQLDSLIRRHPKARAWTVYRSSYTRHHRIISDAPWIADGKQHKDCLVTSIAGVGTMSRQEWEEFGLDGSRPHGNWTVPAEAGGGNTVDLFHAYSRPGERWATERDYIDHIADHGTHAASNVDKALDFVGEYEEHRSSNK